MMFNSAVNESMGYTHYLIHDAFVTHDFKYPPANIKLRVMKEANIMSAYFLNTNRGKQNKNMKMVFKFKIYI